MIKPHASYVQYSQQVKNIQFYFMYHEIYIYRIHYNNSCNVRKSLNFQKTVNGFRTIQTSLEIKQNYQDKLQTIIWLHVSTFHHKLLNECNRKIKGGWLKVNQIQSIQFKTTLNIYRHISTHNNTIRERMRGGYFDSETIQSN